MYLLSKLTRLHWVLYWVLLSTNDDKKMQSIDSIEKYIYGTNDEVIQNKKIKR